MKEAVRVVSPEVLLMDLQSCKARSTRKALTVRHVRPFGLTTLSWAGISGDRDTFRSWGRHDARAVAFCNLGKRPIVANPGDGGHVAHPDGHARYAVWVMLP
jgi:hypothetical protein